MLGKTSNTEKIHILKLYGVIHLEFEENKKNDLTIESVVTGGMVSIVAATSFGTGLARNALMTTVHLQSFDRSTLPRQH